MDDIEIRQLDQLEASHFWYKARKIQLNKWFKEFNESDLIVLDLGSATGGNTLHITSMGHSVTSVEYSDIGISIQNAKGIPAIQADARSLPFANGTFDVVVCLDVLEHIIEDYVVASEIYRVLAPNGHFLISVPEDPKLWSAHDTSVNHVRRYTKGGMYSVLSESKLWVNQIWSTLYLLRPMIVIARKFTEGSNLTKLNPFVNKVLYLICRLELSLPKYPLNGVTMWISGQKILVEEN